MKPRNNNVEGAPSLVVISRPNVQFSPPNQQQQSIDLSKNSPIHVATLSSNVTSTSTPIIKSIPVTNGKLITTTAITNSTSSIPTSHNNSTITLYNHIDESHTSLNLTSDSSGYLTNSTDTSLASVSFNHKANVPTLDEINYDKGPQSHSEQQLQQEVQRIQQQATFNPVQLAASSMTSGRRRTISSNSNR